jgi:hypothetical protein
MTFGAFVRLILLTLVLTALPRQSGAECVNLWKDIPDAKNRFSLIFSGTVIDERPDRDGVQVVFEVDRIWKGSVKRLQVLQLVKSMESFAFQKDEKYLVFADPAGSGPAFDVSQCSPTQVFRAARATIAQLGRGWTPN